jgi:hypothetical protein
MNAKALFIDAIYCSRMAIQSVGLVAQITMKRRQALSAFKKTLILQGIPKKIADELANEYPDPIAEIFSLVKNNTSVMARSHSFF